jgi:hypothetical protein
MSNAQILGALALDLKRVALGYFRDSNAMAEKFFTEALKRKAELDTGSLKPYLLKFLIKLETLDKNKKDTRAENALLYSTIFQNAAMQESQASSIK